MFPAVKRCLAFAVILTVMNGSAWCQDESTLEPVAEPQPVAAAEPNVDRTFIFRMKNKKDLQGVPMEFDIVDAYVMETKISIPIDAIVGIRFPNDVNEKTTIALEDGEILSARIEVPQFRLAAEWGEAKLNRGDVKSMVKSSKLFWQLKDTPNGPKWFLAPKYDQDKANAKTEPGRNGPANPQVADIDVQAYVFPTIDQNDFRWIW